MSNVIKISAHIRKAEKKDLFLNPQEYLKPNQLYFIFCKRLQKIHEADVTSKEVYNSFLHQKLTDLFIFEYIYILDESDSGVPVALALEPALPSDLKYKHLGTTFLRENLQYFIKESSDEVSGPFTLSKKTNLYQMKELLDQGKVYKVCCDQELEILKR